MKSERTRAIVLRRTDYGESDRILQIITPLGKRSAIARGVRKQRSKLAGGIELLTESDVMLRSGKGELMIIGSARTVNVYHDILSDYDKLSFAYEVFRQVVRASEHVDSPEWFAITKEVLMGLNDSHTSLALTKAWFYLQHAIMMGEELNTASDASGQALEASGAYRYDVSEKALVRYDTGDVRASHIKLLRLLSKKPLHVARHVSGIGEFIPVISALAHQHASIE